MIKEQETAFDSWLETFEKELGKFNKESRQIGLKYNKQKTYFSNASYNLRGLALRYKESINACGEVIKSLGSDQEEPQRNKKQASRVFLLIKEILV